MSFALTTKQIQDESKTVTRRDKWLTIRVGQLLRPVNRVMGFKKGEKPLHLLPANRVIEVIDVQRQPLVDITQDDVIKEGFPEMTPEMFVSMYRKHSPNAVDVTRIEFKYITLL